MPLAPDTDNLVIGRGVVYFDREDAAGNPTGELDLGNATTFPLKYAATLKEHFSSRRGVKKRDLIRINEEKFSIDITLEEYSKENLVLAICGDKVEYLTQSAGAGVVSLKASRGRWLETGSRSISNVVVSHGATVFAVINDYLVDPQGGRVMPLSTGAIYENEDLFVSFDYAAINQPVLRPSQREVFGMLRFVPANVVGPNWELKAWKVRLKLKDEIQFIADDWGKIQLTAEVDADVERHPTEPYFTLVSSDAAEGGSLPVSLSLSSNAKTVNQWYTGVWTYVYDAYWATIGNFLWAHKGYAMRHVCTISSVAIPAGATILSAIPKYISSGNYAGVICNVKLHFTDADDAAHPTTEAGAEALVLTTGVEWNAIPAWSTGVQYTGPDMTADLQAIIDRPGYLTNKRLQLVCRDNGSSVVDPGGAYRSAYISNASQYGNISIEITYLAP